MKINVVFKIAFGMHFLGEPRAFPLGKPPMHRRQGVEFPESPGSRRPVGWLRNGVLCGMRSGMLSKHPIPPSDTRPSDRYAVHPQEK
jgi:hypothetical protein